MMRFGQSKGWALKDIFYNAKVIDTGSEVEGSRILSLNEESRLLSACDTSVRISNYKRTRNGKLEIASAETLSGNSCLKAIVLIAIDSGLRKSEILILSWTDFDYEADSVRVHATNSKTERERFAPLTERTKVELVSLQMLSRSAVPFPFKDFKRSFKTAKKTAEVEDLHFHDLRRTAITRWQENGVPLALAGKLAGHTKLQTTMKHYIAIDNAAVADVAKPPATHS